MMYAIMATYRYRTSLATEMSEEERTVDDIIKMFLLNTTRLRPRLTRHKVLAAWYCGIAATAHPPTDEDVVVIPLTAGSVLH